MNADMLLSRIELIIDDIEANPAHEFFEPEDREAFNIVCRIERQMLMKKKND